MGFTIVLFFTALFSTAQAVELTHSGHHLYLDNPQEWEIGKDLFGIPFMLFSPAANGQRSNISFAHTGVELELEAKALKDNQLSYQENKKKWAQVHQVSIKSFLPYQSFHNNHNYLVHSIGMVYESEQKTYIETSYYTECKGVILFSKSLRLEKNSEHEKYFRSLINSLDCGVL